MTTERVAQASRLLLRTMQARRLRYSMRSVVLRWPDRTVVVSPASPGAFFPPELSNKG